MPRIQVLPDLVVNKIAAGEVIERPASVVKELVENAIDAGAQRITVSIEDGGKRLIRVADDGCGMAPDDLRLAVTPHATSKIITEDDLMHIATMGFRGEALPSIGAVSRLRIVSRPAGADEGGEIVVAAERMESASAAGSRVGTTVEVRDLFFNVPARRKFLRSTSTEVGHINEQFARLALAHRNVGFELINNTRTTQQLPADMTAVERIAGLYGRELGDALMTVHREERGLIIEGYLAPPALSRSSANWQYVFLNGRYIRDRFVHHAVREAYRGLMEHTRHPVVFLFLTLDPEKVDINVHPTKIEVRWQDSNLIHSQVLAALREKMLTSDLTPALKTTGGGGYRAESESSLSVEEIRRQAAEALKQASPVVGPPNYDFPGDRATPAPGSRSGGRRFDEPLADRSAPPGAGREVWETLYGRAPAASGQEGQAPPTTESDATDAQRPPSERPLRALQLHNTYLVTETDDGLVIIDQHALHERIMYEKLRQRILGDDLESQRLLLPETFTATSRELAVLTEHQHLLKRLGIEAGPFGADTIAVHALPSILKDIDAASFVRDLLDHLGDKDAAENRETVIHEVLDMMACKAAVKAGDPLSADEIQALVAEKELVEKGSNCPHGRPTTLRLTLADLERQFKRR